MLRIPRRLLLASAACAAGAALFCGPPPGPPQEIVLRYHADATRFCDAVVDCIKADVAERLADAPQRRDMVLNRMNRDLCREQQFALIGKLSVAMQPAALPAETDQALYDAYHACTETVVGAPNCEARLQLYREDPACARLKQYDPLQ